MISDVLTSMRSATRNRKVLELATPILLAVLAINGFNLIDLAFVGHLGKVEIASLGLSAYTNSIALALLVGLATGVQALSARQSAQMDETGVSNVFAAGILLAVISGAGVAAILTIAAKPLFQMLTSDAAVAEAGSSYLLIRLIAIPAMAVNVAFRGYWNGVSRPGIYLLVLLMLYGLNIVLDWLLIFGNLGLPAFGLDGAALAFVIAAYSGVGFYLIATAVVTPGVISRFRLPPTEIFGAVTRISLPAGLQQLLSVLAAPVLLVLMSQIGTTQAAVGTILLYVTVAMVIIGQSFGFASATLTNNSIGARDPVEAKVWGVHVSLLSVIATTLFALPLILAPEFIFQLVTNDRDVIELGAPLLLVAGLVAPINALGMVMIQSLLATGKGSRVVAISLGLQWLIGMPISFYLGIVAELGLWGIWLPQFCVRIIEAAVLSGYWFRRSFHGDQETEREG